jgi:hypothetical protein
MTARAPLARISAVSEEIERCISADTREAYRKRYAYTLRLPLGRCSVETTRKQLQMIELNLHKQGELLSFA